MEYRIVLLPLLLVILFFLYYSNFKSNMIIMLSLVILLVIFDLLNNTEYFESDVRIKADVLDIPINESVRILNDQANKISNLENMIRIVTKYKANAKQTRANKVYPNIPLYNSCIMLDSDGNLGDPIPNIPDTNDIYSSKNKYYHTLGKDHENYISILKQLTN